MRTLRDIPLLNNIPVLVRGALNVPLEEGRVVNDYRLRRALPTLRYLSERGARVVVIGHQGEAGTETLAPVALALARLIPNVSFFPRTVGEEVRTAIRELSPGHILVLENLRRDKREIENDESFAHELAKLADVFVEDSFDVSHRSHASVIGVPKLLPSYAGLLLEEEVKALTQSLSPKHPALAVIGGAKFLTKEAVLTKLLSLYDSVFVGGALANDFLKASGYEVGKSLISHADDAVLKSLIATKKLILPKDVRVIPREEYGDLDMLSQAKTKLVSDVQPDEMILDHGPETSVALAGLAKKAKEILWNGPLGNYENGFTEATDAFAREVASSGAHSVVGGGDTIAAIENLGLLSQFSFVSTGGGAMLQFLAEGTLPGIEALKDYPRD